MPESLRLIRLMAPIAAILLCLSATAWLSIRGARELEAGLDLTRAHVELMTSVSDLNVDFQLAVTKAKNFAILGDGTNRGLMRVFLDRAMKRTRALRVEPGTGEAEALRSITEVLGDVDGRLARLARDPQRGAALLYGRYLKDITLPFDAASYALRDALSERAAGLEARVDERFRLARRYILLSLGLAIGSIAYALLSLLGVGRQMRRLLERGSAG